MRSHARGDSSGSESSGDEGANSPVRQTRGGAPRPCFNEGVDLTEVRRATAKLAELADSYRADLRRNRADSGSPMPPTGATDVCADLEQLAEVQYSQSPIARGEASPNGTVIIFDWDDTLFPTWFIQDVGLPCMSADSEVAIAADSPYREALATHASTLRAALLAARAVAQVAIVTLALRPWVLTSSERFMPGLNFGEFLQRLGIPVYYAREHVKRPDACLAQVEEGVDVFTVAKRATMMKVLRKLYGKRPRVMNVVCIGDSLAERDAIKEVLWAWCEQPKSEGVLDVSLCKTVKFIHQPSLKQLGDQLHLLAMWLNGMESHAEDFDLNMEFFDDLEVLGHGCFRVALS